MQPRSATPPEKPGRDAACGIGGQHGRQPSATGIVARMGGAGPTGWLRSGGTEPGPGKAGKRASLVQRQRATGRKSNSIPKTGQCGQCGHSPLQSGGQQHWSRIARRTGAVSRNAASLLQQDRHSSRSFCPTAFSASDSFERWKSPWRNSAKRFQEGALFRPSRRYRRSRRSAGRYPSRALESGPA